MTKRAWGTEGPFSLGDRLSDSRYSVAGDFSTRNSFPKLLPETPSTASLLSRASARPRSGDSRDGVGEPKAPLLRDALGTITIRRAGTAQGRRRDRTAFFAMDNGNAARTNTSAILKRGRAHFHVIQLASARVSSRVTLGAVTDTAFCWPATDRVLHTEPGE
jgi:hypothetical protein